MMNGVTEKRKKKKTFSLRIREQGEAVRKFFQGGWKIKDVPFYKSSIFQKSLLASGVVLLLSLLLLPEIQFIPSRYQIGTICPVNIKAPQDVDVPDIKATEEKRLQVTRESRSVYDFDLSLVDTLQKKVTHAFSEMNRYYTGKKLREENAAGIQDLSRKKTGAAIPAAGYDLAEKTEQQLFEESLRNFEEILKVKFSANAMKVFKRDGFAPEDAAMIGTMLKTVMSRGVVSSPELLLNEADRGIILKGVGESFEKVMNDTSVFLDLKTARDLIQQYSDSIADALPQDKVKALKESASILVVPNLTFNKHDTEYRKAQAREGVKTVFYKVKKGEMIIREGEKVTEEHLAKLSALNAAQKGSNLSMVFLGLLAFNAILLYIFLFYINRFKRSISADFQKLSLLGLIIVSSLAINKIFYWIARIVMSNLESVEPTSILYAIPYAFCGMLIGVLFEVRIFIFPILIISILSGIMIHEDLSFALYSLVGNVTAAMTVQNCRRRSALLRGGLRIGMVNAVTALTILMVHNDFTFQKGLDNTLFAFIGGILVSILVSWVVPIFETLFRITTDIRLLELSDTNQKVLKDLLVHAPGTYQHSLMVGNLSEEAAEAVGANPLLTRVSSLYHDIGKIQKAEYFVENQINLENPHDKLAPSMSALILISHIKDGAEIAKEHKLPPAILDILRQHHGTSLITFFYQKAKEMEDPDMHTIKEEDYRYPGPKPQTQEAAIVMISDVLEAASRVLTNPTPSRIEGMVNKIMERIYLDGQLDECDLTLKDLWMIKKRLVPVLNSIYHHRIDYPSIKLADDEGGGIKDEGMAQPAAEGSKGFKKAGDVSLEKSLRKRE